MTKLKKLSVIHPFLFALFPILFLFAHNIWEVSAADLLLPIVVVIAGTLILFFSLRLITKSYVKTGIITSFFLILFFSYGHIRDLIYSLEMFDPYNPGDQTLVNLFLTSLWVLLSIAGAFLVTKSRSNFQSLTKFLSVTAATLVIISLINISIYEIKTIDLGQGKINEESRLTNSENLPDIYYIILDEYARADTLKELYNYDNSEFIDYLTSKGFYIASKSRSNYVFTILSLASSLNMEYIEEYTDLEIPFRMAQNNKVSQFLKSKGYRYIFISTGFFEGGMSKYAEVYGTEPLAFGSRMSNLASYLIRSTALAPFAAYFVESNVRTQVLHAFDKLADMPDIKEPKFIYAHIVSPHPPFVFDRNGKHTTSVFEKLSLYEQSYQTGYVDQLIFVNKKVKTLIDEILSESDVAPIIILQADTGPQGLGQSAVSSEAELTKVQIDERMNIFNAYFLPEDGNRLLYQSITPVNSFRIILNFYFDTNYDLLEDKSYFSLDASPCKFIPVPPESNSD